MQKCLVVVLFFSCSQAVLQQPALTLSRTLNTVDWHYGLLVLHLHQEHWWHRCAPTCWC